MKNQPIEDPNNLTVVNNDTKDVAPFEIYYVGIRLPKVTKINSHEKMALTKLSGDLDGRNPT
ncbi:hypothetical protein [Salegentibacter salegens]|uniref:Uncharacterized protein n=1 Tax=Salegentibacter salegens TaxID=143223 RepID=A0A1M7L7I3_9FLAO|nr:hypothetical protein [Salegentibacter salegens]PRX42189.1 hypothetical protein LY58_02815 [Salegentibacter salegens]SHM73980.1 hypothetical protein SAMN05878281_1780 [Salegentibacter salegens]